MNRRMTIIRGLLVGTLLTYIFVPMVQASNVKATLYTNQVKEATYPLHRDADQNGGDEFFLTGNVLATSKHEVRFYYGNSPETWGNGNLDKYTLKKERVMLVGEGRSQNKVITKQMCDGNFAKVIMYGKSKAEPKKQCYANTILKNY